MFLPKHVEPVSRRDLVDVDEWRTGAVGDYEVMNREAFEQVSGDRPHTHDSMRVFLNHCQNTLPHLTASPVGLRDCVYGNERQQRDQRNDCQRADEMLPHQYASPMERCRVIRSRMPLKPVLTG